MQERHRSTPFIPPSSTLQAEGYLVLEFYSGATGLPGRFTEGFSLRRLQQRTSSALRWHKAFFRPSYQTLIPLPPFIVTENLLRSASRLSRRRRQRCRRDPPQYAAKQPPRQMALASSKPVVTRVLDQPSAGFH
jgi:hypothetical protein